jgi:uncharacterized protein (DUF305 family)
MIDRSTISIALGSAVAGALLSALVLLFILPAASGVSAHATEHHQHQATAVMPMCSISSGRGQPSFYSEMAKVNARMHEDMEVLPSGDVSQDFIRMMIPHHQGAIDMALVLLKHEPDERLKRLAQSIIVEQSQEIIYMRTLHNPPLAEPSEGAVSSVTISLP